MPTEPSSIATQSSRSHRQAGIIPMLLLWMYLFIIVSGALEQVSEGPITCFLNTNYIVVLLCSLFNQSEDCCEMAQAEKSNTKDIKVMSC